MADYYGKYYFYPYHWYEPDSLQKMTSLVYSGFTPIDPRRGARLYAFLKEKNYVLGQTSELIKPYHRSEVVRIAF